MHTKLIYEASESTLRSFLNKSFEELKTRDYEMYEELEEDLYKEIYGCHFSEWMLEKALCKMKNEDGTTGGHWDVSTTTQVANNNGIVFDKFNEYDWNYVMNMFYSDYYRVIGNDTSAYVKLSKAFLEDKDAPEGKAYRYYLHVVKED
mgnify:CR=1 FL=1